MNKLNDVTSTFRGLSLLFIYDVEQILITQTNIMNTIRRCIILIHLFENFLSFFLKLKLYLEHFVSWNAKSFSCTFIVLQHILGSLFLIDFPSIYSIVKLKINMSTHNRKCYVDKISQNN